MLIVIKIIEKHQLVYNNKAFQTFLLIIEIMSMATLYIKPLAATFITAILLSGCAKGPASPGKYAEVAKCLTEKGVIMYGAYWCPHCLEQKEQFGDDAQFLTYQECDNSGPDGNHQACLDAGVSSYPTWIFPGQGNLVGAHPIFVVAKLANCDDKLPDEDKKQLREAQMSVDATAPGSVETVPVLTPEATAGDVAVGPVTNE